MAPVMFDSIRRIAPSIRGGFTLVSNYSWMVIVLGVALARLGNATIFRKLQFRTDDATIIAASIFFLGATIAWQYAVNGGLGKQVSELNSSQLALAYKGTYLAIVFGNIAMAIAKISSAALIQRVAPQSRCSKFIMFGMIVVWAVFSLFATLFPCGIPHWTSQSMQCSEGAIFMVVSATNAMTDVVLAVWIVPTLWNLSLDHDSRVAAMLLFGARGSVFVACVGQIWAITKAFEDDNFSYNGVDYAVLTHAVTGLSLVFASLPRINRFVGVAGSGIMIPCIAETEMGQVQAEKTRSQASAVPPPSAGAPQLISPHVGVSSTTISSKPPKKKARSRGQADWQGMISMGSSVGDHTSESSLCEHDGTSGGGDAVQQEVRTHGQRGIRLKKH